MPSLCLSICMTFGSAQMQNLGGERRGRVWHQRVGFVLRRTPLFRVRPSEKLLTLMIEGSSIAAAQAHLDMLYCALKRRLLFCLSLHQPDGVNALRAILAQVEDGRVNVLEAAAKIQLMAIRRRVQPNRQLVLIGDFQSPIQQHPAGSLALLLWISE